MPKRHTTIYEDNSRRRRRLAEALAAHGAPDLLAQFGRTWPAATAGHR